MVTEPIETATPDTENSELGLVPVSEITKMGLVPKSDQIQYIDIDSVTPSPENDTIYKPVDPEDPEIIKLSDSIWNEGVLDPIIYTSDGYIVSGHRRHCAALLAGLEVIPAILSDIRRGDDIDAFTARLAEHNRQRKKTFDEEVREELARQNPQAAYQSLIEERQKTGCTTEAFIIEGQKVRSSISGAKVPFLKAVIEAIRERRNYLPLSVRQIHYALLNDPPLKHARKPGSIYKNDKQSYKSLTDLVARARLEGSISMNAIADPTRPVSCWRTYDGPQTFVESQFQNFMSGYGKNVFEVEALKPEQLEEILKEAIDRVIDTDLFNRELAQEEVDANKIIAFKKVVRKSMMGKTNLVN
ncbi:ParB N-terminal domain-containing protein [uncultured Gimesia sp.]|uniref:ParB/RepB/Spo0J family partition protein n=1 Tax=uncultured Gimesia sp. TaxID=1678688 RepID=UPI0030DA265F